jgi:lipoprotein-anchoring transpeptidase ErfK/SrfK
MLITSPLARRTRRPRPSSPASHAGRILLTLACAALLALPTAPAGATSVMPLPAWSPQLSFPADGQPVVAEVVADAVQVRAYPKQDSDVRREVSTGALLRVFGEAPGIDGDTSTWYATSEGFVPREVLRPAEGQPAQAWVLPDAQLAKDGWWGEVASLATVRTTPSPDAPAVGTLGAGKRVKVLAEEQGTPIGGDPAWYLIDGGRFAGGRVHGSLVTRIDQPTPNTTAPDPAPADGTWITVDRAARTLTFVQGGHPAFTTFVGLGKTGVETATGRYEIVGKIRSDNMSSANNPDAANSYFLPAVPSVQYFRDDGSALHGTYWHDSFGAAESQGCINLTNTDAAYLFGLTSPTLSESQGSAWGAGGTPIVIVN